MRNSAVLDQSPHKVITLVEIPKKSGEENKTEVVSIRFNSTARQYLEGELVKLGVVSKRQRMDFFRGSILAGVENAKRANSPEWKKFIRAVQAPARKILGASLELDDANEIMKSGTERAVHRAQLSVARADRGESHDR